MPFVPSYMSSPSFFHFSVFWAAFSMMRKSLCGLSVYFAGCICGDDRFNTTTNKLLSRDDNRWPRISVQL